MCPKEALSKEETLTLLKWYTQNSRIEENDKLIQMPIGLDYHTISKNS